MKRGRALDATAVIIAMLVLSTSALSMASPAGWAVAADSPEERQVAGKLVNPAISTVETIFTPEKQEPSQVKQLNAERIKTPENVSENPNIATEVPNFVRENAKTVTENQETVIEYIHDPQEVEAIAQTVYGEARGCSKLQQAGVVWCILNRVDSEGFPDTIVGVITQPHQFAGYNAGHPATSEIKELVEDVLNRWMAEKDGEDSVGRVLPSEYLFFTGDGEVNHFRTGFGSGATWNWSFPNPYEGS